MRTGPEEIKLLSDNIRLMSKPESGAHSLRTVKVVIEDPLVHFRAGCPRS